MKNQNPDLLDLEKRLIEKQDKIDKEREDLEKEKDRLKEEREEYVKKLQKASGLTADEAKASLLAEVENSQAQEIAKILKERDEEMKGRIIGKEGRNIRAFEQATGVDVDLDEEGIIRLSSFDQIRREVARRALEKLIKDTRVQPFRIEEIVKETEEEVEKIMFEEGEKLSHDAGVFNLPRELISMLGRFKFRTSYGQNLVVHTLEETKIGIHIAEEIGADVNIVRLGCLFHDIGKVVPGEGSHVKLGVEY